MAAGIRSVEKKIPAKILTRFRGHSLCYNLVNRTIQNGHSRKQTLKSQGGNMKPNDSNCLASAVLILCASVVTAVFTIIASGSFAALIFSGPLQPFIGQGIWIGLFTACVVGLIISLTSSFTGAIAIPQDRVAPILALMAGSMVARMGAASPQEKCLGVMAAIAVVSLTTGAFLFVLGRLKLGNLIRYIPYPVIGGFLAGSGWLLVRGSLRVMTGVTLSFGNLPQFLAPATLLQWLPGIIFGALLFWVLKRFRHPLTVPLMLFGAIALFYVVLRLSGISMDEARPRGWLPSFPSGNELTGVSPFFIINSAPWHLIAQEWSILATILLTSVVSILLTASALELASESEIDLNRELRSAGMATFAAGIGGGMIGFHSLSMSRLVLSMGSRSRWVGVGSAAICGIAIFLGPAVISLVPQYVCGGLLFFLGLTFLWEWVYQARQTLTRLDYLVVLLILGVVGAVGYPEGVGVGIIAAVLMFIHNYSRVDVVTHAFSGADLHSNVDRPLRHLRYLREQGGQIYILRLQGFIFFGTANHLLHEIRVRAMDALAPALRFAIFDFRRVTGLDSSAIFSLSKVEVLARKQGFSLIMTEVAPAIVAQFEKGGLTVKDSTCLSFAPDLDHALEVCESRLLENAGMGNGKDSADLEEQISDGWPVEVKPQRLMPYLERLEVPTSNYLIRQSEKSESLYFIESGRVTAKLEFPGGRALRLRSMGPGTVVGEVGLFLGGVRTASVVTEQACTVYRMSNESLLQMNSRDPELALAFHRYLICVLGERLASNSKILRGIVE
jgi:SulP family sulfate permease